MHQHQSDADAREQIEVVRKFDKVSVLHHFATKCNDKGAAAERVNIWRSRPEPLYEGRRIRCAFAFRFFWIWRVGHVSRVSSDSGASLSGPP